MRLASRQPAHGPGPATAYKSYIIQLVKQIDHRRDSKTAPLRDRERGRHASCAAVSWPGGAGRPGCRAGPPRPNYAQARCRPWGSSPCGAERRAYSDTGSSGRPSGWRALGRSGRSNCGIGLRGARRRRRLGLFRAPAEADRGQPLHQRHAALLGVVVGEFAALRPDLVLRRQRQFVDARHARRARSRRARAPAG